MEIRLSGSDHHQYSHYCSGDPLFQEEKDAVNGPLEELTGRRLPGIMNGSAAMAELADAQDLGSCIERCVGSSPTGRMNRKQLSADGFCWKLFFCLGRENALNGARNDTKLLKTGLSTMQISYEIMLDKKEFVTR